MVVVLFYDLLAFLKINKHEIIIILSSFFIINNFYQLVIISYDETDVGESILVLANFLK